MTLLILGYKFGSPACKTALIKQLYCMDMSGLYDKWEYSPKSHKYVNIEIATYPKRILSSKATQPSVKRRIEAIE